MKPASMVGTHPALFRTPHLARAFDAAIEWLVIALLAFGPLSFGGVGAGSELVLTALATAMVVCLVAKWIAEGGTSLIWSWTYVPLGLFAALAAVQLIRMPVGLVRAVSPGTAAMKSALLADWPGAADRLRSMTVSFYPHATAHGLRLVLIASAVFVVVLNVYRRSDQIKRLLGAIAVIGGVVAAVALGQIVSGTDKLYWLIPAGRKVADGGPFVNHSHYSQFMNLSIGCALAAMFVKLRESFADNTVTPAVVAEHLADRRAWGLWALAWMVVVGAATVFLSLSRGGAVSLLVATGLTAVALMTRGTSKVSVWLMALMALGAMICVLYVGFDAVSARLSTLRSPNVTGRWRLITKAAATWTRFPIFGTGLGTHAVVNPMFEQVATGSLAAHVENEYVQTAEEMGIVGLTLVGALGAIVATGYARCVRHGKTAIHQAAFGLGFGLVAVALGSMTDFGQRLPANACLSAASCALLVRLARPRVATARRPVKGGPNRPVVRILATVAVVTVCVWAVRGAADAYAAQRAWRRALRMESGLRESHWAGSNAQYAALLAAAQTAVHHQPENVEYRYWLSVYRWRSISRKRDETTGYVVVTPRMLARTERISQDLHRARPLCPTFGPIPSVAGQLQAFILDRRQGARGIRRGYELAPCCATCCLAAGLLDARQGNDDDALVKLRRAVRLNGKLFEDAARGCIREAGREKLAVALAGDDEARRMRVDQLLASWPGHSPATAKQK